MLCLCKLVIEFYGCDSLIMLWLNWDVVLFTYFVCLDNLCWMQLLVIFCCYILLQLCCLIACGLFLFSVILLGWLRILCLCLVVGFSCDYCLVLIVVSDS